MCRTTATLLLLALSFVPMRDAIAARQAINATTPGAITAYSTIQCIGIEWRITGDDNNNCGVTTDYRRLGDTAWRNAQPLWRVEHGLWTHGEDPGNLLAGSIFFLDAGTSYEVRLTLSDPDGGASQQVVTVTTRTEPQASPSARTRYVAPGSGGGSGTIADPFLGLAAADLAAQAGDVFVLLPGVYHGKFVPTKDGTASAPIVYRGSSAASVVLDGDGGTYSYSNCVDLSNRRYTFLENMSLGNCIRPILAHSSVGIVVRGCSIVPLHQTLYDRGIYGEQVTDLFVADNTILMAGDWAGIGRTGTYGNGGYGLVVNGNGIIICYNRIVEGWDGINVGDTDGTGPRTFNVDIYDNLVDRSSDDACQTDAVHHNIRIFRNRFINSGSPISFQPCFGGPAYVLYNEMFNSRIDPFKYHQETSYFGTSSPQETSGMLAFQNTSICSKSAWYESGIWHHVQHRNNLLLGARADLYSLYIASGTGGDLDYDGYNRQQTNLIKYNGVIYTTLPAFAAGAGQEQHGLEITLAEFVNAIYPAHPEWDYTQGYGACVCAERRRLAARAHEPRARPRPGCSRTSTTVTRAQRRSRLLRDGAAGATLWPEAEPDHRNGSAGRSDRARRRRRRGGRRRSGVHHCARRMPHDCGRRRRRRVGRRRVELHVHQRDRGAHDRRVVHGGLAHDHCVGRRRRHDRSRRRHHDRLRQHGHVRADRERVQFRGRRARRWRVRGCGRQLHIHERHGQPHDHRDLPRGRLHDRLVRWERRIDHAGWQCLRGLRWVTELCNCGRGPAPRSRTSRSTACRWERSRGTRSAPSAANHTIAATFAARAPYTITASAGAGGTITPSGRRLGCVRDEPVVRDRGERRLQHQGRRRRRWLRSAPSRATRSRTWWRLIRSPRASARRLRSRKPAVLDNFNRSNGSTLGPNWIDQVSSFWIPEQSPAAEGERHELHRVERDGLAVRRQSGGVRHAQLAQLGAGPQPHAQGAGNDVERGAHSRQLHHGVVQRDRVHLQATFDVDDVRDADGRHARFRRPLGRTGALHRCRSGVPQHRCARHRDRSGLRVRRRSHRRLVHECVGVALRRLRGRNGDIAHGVDRRGSRRRAARRARSSKRMRSPNRGPARSRCRAWRRTRRRAAFVSRSRCPTRPT
jgi:hypothetical protein